MTAMRLDIQHLRTLAALRDTESLRHAAERIAVTPSAVSHQLNDLEDLLGCRLFYRKTHPVRFTPAGTRLLALADDVIPDVRRALADLEGLSKGPVDRLFVAVEQHGPTEWLLAAIDEYHRSWSTVGVDVPMGLSLDPLPALARGDLDVVFTTDPIEDPALTYEPLFTTELKVAVAPSHRCAALDWVSPADFAGETVISYPVRRSRLQVFTRFLQPANIEPAHVLATELPTIMVRLAAQRRGVCCLPSCVLEELPEDVLLKPLGNGGLRCCVHVATRPDCRRTTHINAFIKMAKETAFRTLTSIGVPTGGST